MHGEERQMSTGGAWASPVFSAPGAGEGAPVSAPVFASGRASRVGLRESFEAGRVVTRALLAGCGAVRAGATSLSVARAVEAELVRGGAIGVRGVPHGRGGSAFPEACVVSVNDVAADGVPGARALCAGDVVTIDAPASVRGERGCTWADAAVSVVVGDEDGAARAGAGRGSLPHAAREVVRAILAEMGPGRRWSIAAAAGRARARELGVALVGGLDGHGVGRAMHEPPRLSLAPPGAEVELEAGMTLAVEAVVAEGVGRVPVVMTRTDPDGWSERLPGGQRAAGWEVTVRVGGTGVSLVAGVLGGALGVRGRW
jgi:methionyl aminopeptidase